MANLDNTLASIPPGSFTREYGRAYWDGTEWRANIRGGLVRCTWADPIHPAQDGKIVVDITSDGRGLSSAHVSSMYTEQPRPSTGTVTTTSAGEIFFTGDDNKSYSTKKFLGVIGDYTAASKVQILWVAGSPTIIGKVGVLAPPPPAPSPTPTPPAVTTGGESLRPIHSDTWGVGGWGRWAKSTNGREYVYGGSYAGQTLTGSWFYGAPRPVLQGKTITRIRFRLPARENVGSYNAPVTIYIYGHTSSYLPGGDVARVTSAVTVVVLPGHPGDTYIDLPLSFAPTLVAGGGISIAGGDYAGFLSRLVDPLAGELFMDWST